MMGRLRTVLLFVAMVLIMSMIGWFSAGFWGVSPLLSIAIFALLAGGMNLVFYFWSDKMVLASYGAVIVTSQQAPRLHRIVDGVIARSGIPKPRVAIIPTAQPNAFATGRNPKHAVIAATEGILQLLEDDELEGVIAHEISHVKNRDTLVMTIAATMAAAISFAARMLIFSRDRNMNPLVAILVMITAPIAAFLVQLAISRSREFKADATGARMIGNGDPLARALLKLEAGTHVRPMDRGSPATSSLFIVNPFRAGGMATMFSTHPKTEDRVKRLRRGH
jgi:heat shock protein HtpX